MHQWSIAPGGRARRALLAFTAGVTTATLVAGCVTVSPEGPVGEPSAPVDAAPARSTDPSPVVVEGHVRGVDVEAKVGPVAVDGDLAVLRVEVEATGGDEAVMAGFVFANRALTQEDSFDGVRLVDLEAGVVREAARTSDGVALASLGEEYMLSPGREPVVGHVAYDAPTTATTSVLVPAVGLVEGVPVVEAADAGGLTVPVEELRAGRPGGRRRVLRLPRDVQHDGRRRRAHARRARRGERRRRLRRPLRRRLGRDRPGRGRGARRGRRAARARGRRRPRRRRAHRRPGGGGREPGALGAAGPRRRGPAG